MLKNLKIGPRLGLAFSGVLVLFLVTSVFAIVQMNQMSQRVERIVKGFNHEDDLISDMMDQSREIQQHLRTIALSEEGAKEEAAAIAETLHLLQAGDHKGGITRLLDSAKLQETFLGSSDNLSQLMKTRMDATYQEAQAGYQRSRNILTLILVLAMSAGVFFALLITRSITRPIRSFQETMAAAARGDLTVAARVDSQDEVGGLGVSLNQMLEGLRVAFRNVATASAAVASGAAELSSSSEEMSVTTGEIAKGSEAIHGITAQMASAMNQLAASVHQVADNLKVSMHQSGVVVQAATEGGQGGTEAVQRMKKIQEAITSLASLTQEVSAATSQQAVTALQVARHVDDAAQQVGRNAAATQQLSATVNEISRTAADLARISDGLAQSTALFRV